MQPCMYMHILCASRVGISMRGKGGVVILCDRYSGDQALVAGAGAARTCGQKWGGFTCRVMGKASHGVVFQLRQPVSWSVVGVYQCMLSCVIL